ncbi:hypothetical protein VL2_gp016 [Pseudomonas phage vB_PaeM_VL12]|uniref:Uncharacterized protein n=7 Tax=Nankokuvirus TaxID=1925779 RepID=A0A218L3U3_9CAUD|nr:hypothetical protein [Pseudomonas aeruginosa]YP_004306730.1 hypothetical protein KPP10_gp137 [Pseudomonas phage KPP10]YP_009205995.1 hypothetical protein AVT15_gp030 [Pseudomonas phage vB_PaeM_PS24]YP_009604658.1 hypothetical protein FDH93_gp031 [Pseudomonas phage vB_PaeM_G1]QIQ63947.1 hypothetical protein Epa24_00025 [Pseudomonas phage Epa24]QIQ64201.1 hypothetical protein Epa17_00132 [Pseudomonas phage Epa17]QIQ65092.1 hypothetical protein 16_00051 [Pseudomonas phage Epa16]QIQ65729.1 hy
MKKMSKMEQLKLHFQAPFNREDLACLGAEVWDAAVLLAWWTARVVILVGLLPVSYPLIRLYLKKVGRA